MIELIAFGLVAILWLWIGIAYLRTKLQRKRLLRGLNSNFYASAAGLQSELRRVSFESHFIANLLWSDPRPLYAPVIRSLLND